MSVSHQPLANLIYLNKYKYDSMNERPMQYSRPRESQRERESTYAACCVLVQWSCRLRRASPVDVSPGRCPSTTQLHVDSEMTGSPRPCSAASRPRQRGPVNHSVTWHGCSTIVTTCFRQTDKQRRKYTLLPSWLQLNITNSYRRSYR